MKFEDKISSLITAIERTSVTDVIASDSQTYVPVDTGALRDSIKVTDRTISWGGSAAPYARYVYYIPKNHAVPTQDRWLEKASAVHGKEWVRKLKDRIIENAELDPGFN